MTIFIFVGGVVFGLLLLVAAYSFFSSRTPLEDETTSLMIQAMTFIMLSGIAALMLFKL